MHLLFYVLFSMMKYYASCPFFSCYMFCNLYVNSVTTLKLNDFCEYIQCIVFVKLIFMTGHLTSLFQVIIYSNSFTGVRVSLCTELFERNIWNGNSSYMIRYSTLIRLLTCWIHPNPCERDVRYLNPLSCPLS